ncbi:MAG: DNA adenine methylase [Bacteroidetes bacterium]|nr:MAG: DNA adenine methylase [Bacteroidota bacterium]
MILTRLGNKRKIAHKIIPLLPPEETIRTWIEPFFGAGGMFFNRPKAKYNILNDLDSEVYNLFNVVVDQHEELGKQWLRTPLHEDLWNRWKNDIPEDPVKRAVRFLQLSNLSFLGKGQTIRWNSKNTRKLLMERLEAVGMMMYECEFMNTDFRNVIRRISLTPSDKAKAFIYCDPPYLETTNNYSSGFTEKDSCDLFEMLNQSGIRFAMSEFDHPYIIGKAREYNLNVIKIGERQNLKNKRVELLITNY